MVVALQHTFEGTSVSMRSGIEDQRQTCGGCRGRPQCVKTYLCTFFDEPNRNCLAKASVSARNSAHLAYISTERRSGGLSGECRHAIKKCQNSTKVRMEEEMEYNAVQKARKEEEEGGGKRD